MYPGPKNTRDPNFAPAARLQSSYNKPAHIRNINEIQVGHLQRQNYHPSQIEHAYHHIPGNSFRERSVASAGMNMMQTVMSASDYTQGQQFYTQHDIISPCPSIAPNIFFEDHLGDQIMVSSSVNYEEALYELQKPNLNNNEIFDILQLLPETVNSQVAPDPCLEGDMNCNFLRGIKNTNVTNTSYESQVPVASQQLFHDQRPTIHTFSKPIEPIIIDDEDVTHTTMTTLPLFQQQKVLRNVPQLGTRDENATKPDPVDDQESFDNSLLASTKFDLKELGVHSTSNISPTERAIPDMNKTIESLTFVVKENSETSCEMNKIYSGKKLNNKDSADSYEFSDKMRSESFIDSTRLSIDNDAGHINHGGRMTIRSKSNDVNDFDKSKILNNCPYPIRSRSNIDQPSSSPTENDASSSASKKRSRVDGDSMSNQFNLYPIHSEISPPEFPTSGSCTWSYDPTTFVVLAKLHFTQRGRINIDPLDLETILDMMERPDITLVIDGLSDGLDPNLWSMETLEERIGQVFHYKFALFDRVIQPRQENQKQSKRSILDTSDYSGDYFYVHEENPNYCSMLTSDYFTYLRKRQKALSLMASKRLELGLDPLNPISEDDNLCKIIVHDDQRAESFNEFTKRREKQQQLRDKKHYVSCSNEKCACKRFHEGIDEWHVFKQHDASSKKLNVVKTCIYLTDFDLIENMPIHYDDLVSNFALPGLFPGGSLCMMNALTPASRPFMGPNLYITPPGSFTHFHQDGFGTVDSGHICLAGYNEIVMLRRLPSIHKENAMNILTGRCSSSMDMYDGLYKLPHGSDNPNKPQWPSHSAIQECKRWGYRPSVFILKPGQFVHINKGRIHAFRKMSTFELIEEDCHSQLRKDMNTLDSEYEEKICVSIAWDWLFLGQTPTGIRDEFRVCLESSSMNRCKRLQSLAIPEASLLFLATEYLSQFRSSSVPSNNRRSFIRGGFQSETTKQVHVSCKPRRILEGIFPSLKEMVMQHKLFFEDLFLNERNLSVTETPIAKEYRATAPTNPFGNDYYCKICYSELSNMYMHCDGCENILNRDFNICARCYGDKLFIKEVIQMDASKTDAWTNLNHVVTCSRTCKCRSKPAPSCIKCFRCCACSCECHASFTVCFRFMTIEDETNLLAQVETILFLKDTP